MTLKGREALSVELALKNPEHARLFPRGVRRRGEAAMQRYAEEHNERYRVIATDEHGPIIAEERDARMLKRLSPKARRLAGALLTLPRETRREVLEAFYSNGDVKYPW